MMNDEIMNFISSQRERQHEASIINVGSWLDISCMDIPPKEDSRFQNFKKYTSTTNDNGEEDV